MSTGDFIAFNAAARPDAVAIIDRGRAITYGELHRDLGRFVRAVAELGLPRGSSAAISWGDLYPHWLLLMACEWLGIATATFFASEVQGSAGLLETVDLVMSERRPPQVDAKRHLALTGHWLADIFARAETGMPAALPENPDDPLRIVRTSGTTGVAKRLRMTRHTFEAVVRRWAWFAGITRASSSLVNSPFTATGSYTLSTAVLRAGGTVIHAGAEVGALGALLGPGRAITHLRIVPQELKVVLDGLPPDFAKPANLTVFTIGAPLAASLREEALARLASEVVVSYACNEMPFVSLTRTSGSEGIQSVCPWVDVEIVDEHDVPLPSGTAGTIRLREDAMATGYLDDAETTARKFRNGWFYPGDVGILHGPRRLQVIGREDDLLNIGGFKVSPSTLEADVLRHATVGDIGVCTVRNPAGIEEICVAVAGSAHGDAELLARVTKAFSHRQVGRFFLIKLSHIPRNANGKIERERLKEMAVAAVSQARDR